MFKSKKIFGILIAVAVSLALFATPAFAAGTVSVTVTYGNFELGEYEWDGDGFTNAYFYIDEYPVDIDYVQEYVDYGWKEYYYLPDPSYDYLDGEASILDAILVALTDNGFAYVPGDDMISGWDYEHDPNGGYIEYVYPEPLDFNEETVIVDNVEYTHYFSSLPNGGGWRIAYTLGDDPTVIVPEEYTSRIALEDGMTIIFDYSPYDYWVPEAPPVQN
ncbi:MAG: hypothetical protein LBK56_13945 [Gracilibacteraceae bacterium]|jgi:hypothetical protein|nr:hypothetical protein [Gracilibacteraceae bacterium]